MAISALNVGGTTGARPSVGAFFGKSTAANDNAQKVSSDFISGDMMSSILGSISGISAELKKIQQLSKDVIKSFERLVADMRKLNNDITAKFKSVNAQMKKDNVDFLRSITRSYGDALEAVNVPEKAVGAVGAAAATAAAPAGGSIADAAASIASTAADLLSGSKKAVGAAAAKETVKDVAKGASKPTLKAVVKKVAASAGGKMLAKAIPGVALVAGLFSAASRAFEGDFKGAAAEATLGAAATIPGVGTAASVAGNVALLARDIYKEYYGVQPEDDPQAKERLQEIVDMLKSEISGDVKETVIKVGGEEVKQGEPLSDKQMIAVEGALAMGNNNYPDWLMEQYNKQKGEKAAGAPAGGNNTAAAPPLPQVSVTANQPTGADAATGNEGTPAQGQTNQKTPSAPAAEATTATPPAAATPAAEATTGAPMKVADIPSSVPADTPAEGGNATAAAAAPTNAPPPAAPAMGTPAQVEEDFSNLANVSGVQVEKGKDLPDKAMMTLDAMMENDPEATARKYPAWVLEQYAKQSGKEGSPAGGMGDQTKPDLGTGGEDATGGGGGGGGGESTGKPEGEVGAPGGTPEPIQSAPPNVPADLAPPSQTSQNNKPIVMNNESSSSSGSVTSGEADNMSGQNLPMTAQNEALTEYFAKQNIDYQ
jgi:hypothetical protein